MALFTRQLGAGLRILLALTVLTGVLYPLVVLGVGQGIAHDRANGSLLTRDGTVVASSSLGQAVPEADAAQWFQPRPSASDYAGDSSGGTNLGPSSPDLAKAVGDRESGLKQAGATGTLPPDALTSSGSGLDPDISPRTPAPGRPGRAGARPEPGRRREARPGAHQGPDPRLPRRAAGQHDRAQPRAQPALLSRQSGATGRRLGG